MYLTQQKKKIKKLLVTNTGWTQKIFFFVLNVFNTAKKTFSDKGWTQKEEKIKDA